MTREGNLRWVKTLNKQELIIELQKRNVYVEESEKFDTLREKLQELIREELNENSENSGATSSLEERKSPNVDKKDPVVDASTIVQTSKSDEMNDMADGIKVEFRLHKDDWETFTEQL